MEMHINKTSLIGNGMIREIPRIIKDRRFYKGLIITDQGLVKCGAVDKLTLVLERANIKYEIFDGVVPDPTVKTVEAALAQFEKSHADYLIAFGGGSVIDTSKAVGIMAANPDLSRVTDLLGLLNTRHPAIPTIAVPTTAGTGSEGTIFYVITEDTDNNKLVGGDKNCLPEVAVIDYDILCAMPPKLTRDTGMDALVHSIESYVATGSWEFTETLSYKAMTLIGRNLEKAALQGEREAKEKIALGEYMAGIAFSNSGLGAVHSMAHQIGSFQPVPHGEACAIALPWVLDFNRDAIGKKMFAIARALGIAGTDGMSERQCGDTVIAWVRDLCEKLDFPKTMRDVGIHYEDFEEMAKRASKDLSGGFNPRPASPEDFIELFKKAF